MEKLLALCAPGSPFRPTSKEFDEVAAMLRDEGEAGSRALAGLITELANCRHDKVITEALRVAARVPAVPELRDAVRSVAGAPELARRPVEARFTPEVYGEGQVGWTSGTHRAVVDAAGEALRFMEPRLADEALPFGATLRTLTGHAGWVLSCAWSPDGKRILSSDEHGVLRMWDPETGTSAGILRCRTDSGYPDSVALCAFSADSARIASAGATVRVWDANSGQQLKTLDAGGTCAWSPDGRRIVAPSWGPLKVFDAESAAELAILTGHSDRVEGCAYSPDGTRIVSASQDRTLKVWDAATGQELAILAGHSDRVEGCAYSPDGTRIASASSDGTLKLWDAATGQELATLQGHEDQVRDCAYSPEGTRIASASHDGTLRIWKVERGGPIVVTAAEHGARLVVRCPHCSQEQEVERVALGSVTSCPTPGCGLELRLNPFVLAGTNSR